VVCLCVLPQVPSDAYMPPTWSYKGAHRQQISPCVDGPAQRVGGIPTSLETATEPYQGRRSSVRFLPSNTISRQPGLRLQVRSRPKSLTRCRNLVLPRRDVKGNSQLR